MNCEARCFVSPIFRKLPDDQGDGVRIYTVSIDCAFRRSLASLCFSLHVRAVNPADSGEWSERNMRSRLRSKAWRPSSRPEFVFAGVVAFIICAGLIASALGILPIE